MALDITGKLHKVFETEQKTESFKAREFVIETAGEYPQFVKFQLTQDRCAIVDSFKEGDALKVHFDLRGREWQEKYFTNLNAWKIEGDSGMSQAPPAQEQNFNQEAAPAAPVNNNVDAREDLDDLPF
ncbi:MAG: single-strand DNA-binding protein [Chitinophagales bacterium]|jgi:single-strand DNA-binding protein